MEISDGSSVRSSSTQSGKRVWVVPTNKVVNTENKGLLEYPYVPPMTYRVLGVFHSNLTAKNAGERWLEDNRCSGWKDEDDCKIMSVERIWVKVEESRHNKD